MDAVRCTCGASGDAGEMVAHMADALLDLEDGRTHVWLGGEEPARVAQARETRRRRDRTARALADAAGVSVEELREVLH